MAEEEKEEQVIVIEDLDEDEQDNDLEDKESEKEEVVEEESTEDIQADGIEEETLTTSFLRNRKKLVIAGIALLSILIILSILAYIFIPSNKPKKQAVKKVHKVEKQTKTIKKPKKKKSAVRRGDVHSIVDSHFINALRLQQKGEYQAAIKELKQASIDLYLSYFGIGYIYLKLGDVDKAKLYLIDKTKQYLLLSVENNPNYTLGDINLFRIYMANKEYDKADKILNILKNKNVPQKEMFLMKAYYDYVVKKDKTQLLDMLKLYPNESILNGLLGSSYLKDGDLDKALYYIDKAIKPYLIGSLCYNKILMYVSMGDYKQAMKCISKSYYMDFDRIKCKNYLSFFVFLHERKLKAAYEFYSLNKEYSDKCFSHFKITPTLRYSISKADYIKRKSINYLLTAEILNMYLRPIKLDIKGAAKGLKLGELYDSLGLVQKAKANYQDTASFAEAVLLSQKAINLYVKKDLKGSLLYYKKALAKLDTNPILLYNVAIMYLKNHQPYKADEIFTQLRSAYSDFPLPYLGKFIIKQINGNHRDAMKQLKSFLIKLNHIPSEKVYKDMADMGVFAYYVSNGAIEKKLYDRLTQEEKHLFLLIKASMGSDLGFLRLEKEFESVINLNIDASSYTTILEYFNKAYKNNIFIKRTLSDCYLFDKQYNKAYRALFGIPQYSSEDYYKLGIAYLMSGFNEAADNFFTKSILKGIDLYNAYMAKAIMQAQKGDLKGIIYYLKIMLKKDMAWYNTYIFLSFNMELI